jgi:hypothetical protein
MASGATYRAIAAAARPARELTAGLIDAGARHPVLGPSGMPSARWLADEIIRPILSELPFPAST